MNGDFGLRGGFTPSWSAGVMFRLMGNIWSDLPFLYRNCKGSHALHIP